MGNYSVLHLSSMVFRCVYYHLCFNVMQTCMLFIAVSGLSKNVILLPDLLRPAERSAWVATSLWSLEPFLFLSPAMLLCVSLPSMGLGHLSFLYPQSHTLYSLSTFLPQVRATGFVPQQNRSVPLHAHWWLQRPGECPWAGVLNRFHAQLSLATALYY